MRKQDFLSKMISEGILELVDPSPDICESYIKKADDSLKAAKILYDARLYENSVSSSYYSMYNTLLALLFRCGIKSENHTASIMLLNKLFGMKKINETMTIAKKERIDKQYYISSNDEFKVNENIAKQMIKDAEDVNIGLTVFLSKLKLEEINLIREKFNKLK